MPFQPGNQDGKKNKVWAATLARAMKSDDYARVRQAADQLLDLAAAGEQWAIKELADRLDGKSPQSQILSGPDDGPIELNLPAIRFVKD